MLTIGLINGLYLDLNFRLLIMKMNGILKDYSIVFSNFLKMLDILGLFIASYISFYLYLADRYTYYDYHEPIFIAILIALLILPVFGLYRTWRGLSLFREIKVITLSLSTVFLILATIAVLTKTNSDYSRVWFVLWYCISWFLLVLIHTLVRISLRWLRSIGLNYRNIIIVGSGKIVRTVYKNIEVTPWAGFRIIGVFGDGFLELQKEGIYKGGFDKVAAYVNSNNVDQVWIAMPLSGEKRLEKTMFDLRHSTVDIHYVPDIFGFQLLNHSFTEIAGMPVVNLSVSPMDGLNRWVKLFEDKVLAFILLMIVMPVMLIIGLIIKLTSPGPIIFQQLRHGWDGKTIKVYKFRSMICHQEKGVITQASKNDIRVTKFGRFLRSTSLDELPQLYNVLQGTMSLVGPRPHAVKHNEEFMDKIDGYMLRHKVKPGITGWAQINGFRGETDTIEKMKNRIDYDLYYIANWSLWFDIKIIFITIFKGFLNKNAY